MSHSWPSRGRVCRERACWRGNAVSRKPRDLEGLERASVRLGGLGGHEPGRGPRVLEMYVRSRRRWRQSGWRKKQRQTVENVRGRRHGLLACDGRAATGARQGGFGLAWLPEFLVRLRRLQLLPCAPRSKEPVRQRTCPHGGTALRRLMCLAPSGRLLFLFSAATLPRRCLCLVRTTCPPALAPNSRARCGGSSSPGPRVCPQWYLRSVPFERDACLIMRSAGRLASSH